MAEAVQQRIQGKLLEDPEKSWVNKAAKGVLCLKLCFLGDKEQFLLATKNYSVTKFKCTFGENHNKALEYLCQLVVTDPAVVAEPQPILL